MDTANVLPVVALIMSIITLVFHAVRHKTLLVKLCGKVFSCSVDVVPFTPEPELRIPPPIIEVNGASSQSKPSA